MSTNSDVSNALNSFVIKRNGNKEPVSFDKIIRRIAGLSQGLHGINIFEIVQEVISDMTNGISTKELDDISARLCANRCVDHPDYETLAGRILISSHHKNLRDLPTFSSVVQALWENVDEEGTSNPLIAKDKYDFIMRHKDAIDAMVDYEKDYMFGFFSFRTHENGYLLRHSVTKRILERQQDLLMRVAIQGAWDPSLSEETLLQNIRVLYEQVSDHKISFATPTQFNACTPNNQNASCFLLTMVSDSIEGIYETKKRCALISKRCGGIGVSITNLRSRGALIRGTNGRSCGVLPWIKGLEQDALGVNQGDRRNGSFALYIEPWHPDLYEFLAAADPKTEEHCRADKLFYGLWIPNEFFERCKKARRYNSLAVRSNLTYEEQNEMNELEPYTWWYFICPDKCPELIDLYGDAFSKKYMECISKGMYKDKKPILDVVKQIIKTQIETGKPYIGAKCHVNNKSNHKHLGTIRNSNLCIEIVEIADEDNVAVCNLASISLPIFVYKNDDGTWAFDFDALYETVKLTTRSLDNIIDDNLYPIPECKRSNNRDRPIGMGVQGYHDVFLQMGIVWESEEALDLNCQIFECMQHAFLTASCELAQEKGAHESFPGSPLSQGLFSMDLWKQHGVDVVLSGRYDWEELRKNIMKHGVRNSLGLALMPTASTSQILGNSIAFEPYNGNIFMRRTLAGEFTVVNKYLQNEMIEMGIWNQYKEKILAARSGSIQNIQGIPQELKDKYKIVYDLGSRTIIDHAAARAPFICQTQSMNLFFEKPTTKKLLSAMLYGYDKGLKTLSYYIRHPGKAKTTQFALSGKEYEEQDDEQDEEQDDDGPVCRMEDGCVMCSA